jgi:hypothetical protein
MVHVWVFLLLALASSGAMTPQAMQSPVPCKPNATVEDAVKNILKCECVDLDGDGAQDFIVLGKSESASRDSAYLGRELWIASGGRIILRQDRWLSDYAFRWFVNLDGDPVPEIISAYGFSDGIDYTIEKLDVEAGTRSDIFHFEPVLIDADGQKYHGYPWDLKDIRVRRQGDRPEILAAMSERVPSELQDGDDNAGISADQRRIPRILFTGESTQPDLARLRDFDTAWYSLESLWQLSFK